VTIFQPEAVTPLVLQTGDLSGLGDLSSFGTVTGNGSLELTPEPSAGALSTAAGFPAPELSSPPSGTSTGPSYWLVGPDYAQLQISVAKAQQAAVAAGTTVRPPPAGVDRSTLRVATGNGILEVWGLPDISGFGQSVGGFRGRDLPELAVAEIEGPTVSSSGVSVSTLEAYLLSQPGVSPDLATKIRAIGDPGSTLPIPVAAGGTSSTVDLSGHPAVVSALEGAGHLVIWASNGHLFAVFGRASAPELIDVARQLA
jgi:hypothetical protein